MFFLYVILPPEIRFTDQRYLRTHKGFESFELYLLQTSDKDLIRSMRLRSYRVQSVIKRILMYKQVHQRTQCLEFISRNKEFLLIVWLNN